MVKKCRTCHVIKDLGGFYTKVSSRDGHQNQCKECFKCEVRQNSIKNREAVAIRMKRYRKVQLENFRDEINREARERYIKNKHKKSAYYQKNRTKINNYQKNRRKEHPQYRIAANLRRRISKALNGKCKPGSMIENLGCSLEFFKHHIESKFQPGMTWKNYGEWHVDHIMPLSAFDLTDSSQFKQACHYKNLRPLWARDNLSKGSKIISEMIGL